MTLKEQMKYTRDTVLLIYKNNSGPDGIDLSPANLHRDEKSHGPVHLEDCAVLADSQSLWGCSATNSSILSKGFYFISTHIHKHLVEPYPV